MLELFKRMFKIKPKYIEFCKNSSWMLDACKLLPDYGNIKKCREFATLKQTKQNKKYHKEGNVWNHTVLVTKEMYKIINKELSHLTIRDKAIMMLAALCHDLGKATTTYFDKTDNEWHCKSHGLAGERITRNLIYAEKDYNLREEVCWLVRWHMTFHHFLEKSESEQLDVLKKLSMGYSTVEKLLWLNIADSRGSKSSDNTREMIENKFREIKELAERNKCYRQPYKTTDKKKSNFTVYIMIGLPGSGKDTYIRKFIPNIECICRDDIREEILDGNVIGRKLYFDNAKETAVTDIVNSRIKKCCEEKKSFVINQTNVKKKYRTQLIQTAEKYGANHFVYIYVEAPSVEECKKRRGNGKWDSIIDRMWNDFEFPDRSECDDLIFYKNNWLC